MKRLLLIVALALMSGACASAPQYHAVLIPPMSTTEPAIPRPPVGHVDADVVIDDVKTTPRPPIAVVEPTTSTTEVLKSQINNLLAQVDSLQSVANDRRPAKLERYARELATTKAGLKAAQAERDKVFTDYILSKQETAILERDRNKVRSLLAAKRGGDMQWRAFTLGQSQDKQAELRDWVIGGTLSLLALVAFVFALGWRNGKIKAEDFASARITALKDANEGKNLYITELRGNLAKKGNHIAELEMMLKEERRTYRNRIQELKRQRAGPLPETVDDDLSPESVFGPLERDDEQKE